MAAFRLPRGIVLVGLVGGTGGGVVLLGGGGGGGAGLLGGGGGGGMPVLSTIGFSGRRRCC